MKFYKIFFLIFLLISFDAFGGNEKATTDENSTDETIEEFNETRFISLDKIYTPKELNVISDELTQNSIDVVILTGTHSLVYNTQMSEAGQTKQYKNFYGLKIEILPIPNKESSYSLRLFYYNWLSKKFDKKLYKEISKFNVLNELRFALYKLFKGNKFVEEHQEMIEKSNYERIQAVAKTIEERKIKKKQELKKKQLEQSVEETLNEKKKEKTELLKREEEKKKPIQTNNKAPTTSIGSPPPPTPTEIVEKNEKIQLTKINEQSNKDSTSKANKKSNQTGDSNSKEQPGTEEAIPRAQENPQVSNNEITKYISKITMVAGISGEFLNTTEILNTKTNLRYLNLGANFQSYQEKLKPFGYSIEFLSGIPIRKDNYQLPVFRQIKVNGLKKDLIPYIIFKTGLEYSPIHFINLPEAGKNLQVYENDLLWVNLSISGSIYIYDKIFEISLAYLSSLLTKSNYEKKFNANRIIPSIFYQMSEKHGIKIEMIKTSITGQVIGNGSGISLQYSYFFGG